MPLIQDSLADRTIFHVKNDQFQQFPLARPRPNPTQPRLARLDRLQLRRRRHSACSSRADSAPLHRTPHSEFFGIFVSPLGSARAARSTRERKRERQREEYCRRGGSKEPQSIGYSEDRTGLQSTPLRATWLCRALSQTRRSPQPPNPWLQDRPTYDVALARPWEYEGVVIP